MSRNFIDLSIYLENDVVSDPPPFGPKITYMNHQSTFSQMAPFFPGLKKEDLPDGEAWAIESVTLITHNGTHLDAPYHFHSTMNKGERAITIDEVPLEWCFQPGVKLDFRHFPDGYVVTAADVEQELRQPRTRRHRHRARSVARAVAARSERIACTARAGRASATSTGHRPKCWRITPWRAATCSRAISSEPARSQSRNPARRVRCSSSPMPAASRSACGKAATKYAASFSTAIR